MRIVRFSEPVIHLVSTAFHRTGGGQEGGQGWGGGQGWRYSKYKNRPFPSSKDPLLVQCYHWRLFFVSTGEPFGRWRSVSKECLSSKKSLWCREISPFPLTSAVSTDHAFSLKKKKHLFFIREVKHHVYVKRQTFTVYCSLFLHLN